MEMESLVLGDTSEKKKVTGLFRVIFLYKDYEQCLLFSERFADHLQIEYFNTKEAVLDALDAGFPADSIIADVESGGWELLALVRSSVYLANLPVILVVEKINRSLIEKARVRRADDIFARDFDKGDLVIRLQYFFRRRWYVAGRAEKKMKSIYVKVPLWKRILDIGIVGMAIIALIPIWIVVVILIRIDSRGPVIYKSKRVGSGFRIFDLYKFRTMRTNADQLLKGMSAMNMYHKMPEQSHATTPVDETLCSECQRLGLDRCQQMLFLDGKEICEKEYQRQKDQKAAFMKFQNDPRITGIGKFLRNTSLDELPQLFNILQGDMSLVGNRPLPLYEAEKLTTDEKIMRFACPAGLTGLWQVTKRGKGKADMTESERLELDIIYAHNFSFWMDLKIILKTIPALIQKENV